MQAELKKKWIEALRSGRYKQTTNTLRDVGYESSYCCLGVLCEISGRGKWADDSTYQVELDYSEFELSYAYMNGDLSGFGEHLFEIPDRIETILIKMNDDGSSFEEIADEIERVL